MRLEKPPFYSEKVVFVKKPFVAHGRSYKHGDEFKWKERRFPEHKVAFLYKQNFLMHDADRVAELSIGDGLDSMTIEELAGLVNEINKKVKTKTSTETEFSRKRCKKSKLRDKQAALIRQWRGVYGDLELDVE